MMSSSSQLPLLQHVAVEVQLNILEFLQCTSDESEYEYEEEPLENWQSIPVKRRFRWLEDLLNLSSTCKWFRDLLAPRIFQAVYLHNTVESALSIRALAEGKHAEFVKELCYVGSCDEAQQKGPLRVVYPQEVDDVLSNLPNLFPSLEKLKADFPFDYDNSDIMVNYLQDYEFNPSYDDSLVEESKDAWRGLMAQSFKAFSRNFSYTRNDENGCPVPQIHHFDVQSFNIVPISTLCTEEFQNSLSLLKTFKLSLDSGGNSAGWNITTKTIFRGLPPCLEPWFFNNLSSVEDFSFDPTHTAVLGGGWHIPYSIAIPLKKPMMPKLRKVTIQNVLLGRILIDFFTRHSNTLESITLGDCYGVHPDTDQDEPFFWHELFDSLANASRSISKLTSFNLFFIEAKDSMLGMTDTWLAHNYPDRDKIVRAKVVAEPDISVFPYAELDSKYGYATCNEPDAQDCFLNGRDHCSYLKLRDLVDTNADAKGVARSSQVIYGESTSD